MAKKKEKFRWFNSTLATLLLLFLAFAGYGVYFYGWQRVIDESIFYVIGCTFAAILIMLVGLVGKRQKWW